MKWPCRDLFLLIVPNDYKTASKLVVEEKNNFSLIFMLKLSEGASSLCALSEKDPSIVSHWPQSYIVFSALWT